MSVSMPLRSSDSPTKRINGSGILLVPFTDLLGIVTPRGTAVIRSGVSWSARINSVRENCESVMMASQCRAAL